jgi:hypothetical protein
MGAKVPESSRQHSTNSLFCLVPGIVEHIDSLVVDCVLPPVSRDYSADIARRTVAGKVCALHDDIGYV